LGWFSGFAAFRAESLWLSVKTAILFAATPPRRSLICINELAESQKLSAREAAKPLSARTKPRGFPQDKTSEAFCTGGGEAVLRGTKPQSFP